VIIRLVLCSLICAESQAPAVAPSPPTPQEVGERPLPYSHASDARHRSVIVGRLGLPLGTPLLMGGVWETNESAMDVPVKTTSPTFVALTVNGKRLDKPVRFASDLMSPRVRIVGEDPPRNVGDSWEVRAVESGCFPGVPHEACEERFVGLQLAGAWGVLGSGFRTEIKYLAPPAIRRQNAPGTSNSRELSLRAARLKNAALEWSVLEAVLVDIINRNAARFPDGGRDETIVFATARPGKLVSASELIDSDNPPSGLSAVQFPHAMEAAKSAAWAQHERDFVESFRPKDARIEVLDERRPEAGQGVKAERTSELIRAHTPGFSKDQQVAIVRVELGFGIRATYILARQDRKWLVLARAITGHP
jgi:hypothetical protein